MRRHLSAIKGGRLAAAAFPGRVVSLIISDVPGDDPAAIASGPTVADPTTFAEAAAILARYGIEPPASVRGAPRRRADETPKPGDPRLATRRDAGDRDAAAVARGRGRGGAGRGGDAADPRRRARGRGGARSAR